VKHETAKRLAQRIKAVLDVAKSKGFRDGENPVTTIRDARVLPQVKQKVQHHKAMHWQDVPSFYAELATKDAMAARALMFTCLTASRTSEVLQARWEEFDFDERIWTVPAYRMKADKEHRVPLTEQMLAIITPLRALRSEVMFEGQKRHKPMSNMAMLMLLRR
jgi:integrase